MTNDWVCAIDTSADIAVGLTNGEVVISVRDTTARAHAELLETSLDRACTDAGISLEQVARYVVGLGPGPFTGLRVGIVTARMLAALGGDFPATMTLPKGVCSLDVLAQQWVLHADAPQSNFVVCQDARRRELYWAEYRCDGTREAGPFVGPVSDIPSLPAAGPGVELYPEHFESTHASAGVHVNSGGPRHIDPGVMAASIDVLADMGTEPLYLRQPDATQATTRKATLTRGRIRLGDRG